MGPISLLVLAAGGFGAPLNASGIPHLQSPTAFKILTCGVVGAVHVDKNADDGTLTIDSTTVYRNMGGNGAGTVTVPTIGFAGSVPEFPIIATWDQRPVNLIPGKTSDVSPNAYEVDLTGKVQLGDQATHALRIHYKVHLHRCGLGGDEFELAYRLDPTVQTDLFTMSIGFDDGAVFNLPEVESSLPWEIGSKGVSIRKTAFVGPGDWVRVRFYPYSFRPIG